MRQIRRVGVLGAGVMGAAIAAHLANAGLEVLLLDMVPTDLNDEERARGLALEHPAVRNRLAANGLAAALAARPAAFYLKDYAAAITVGNFSDDAERLRECDWVIEVVVENLAIKHRLFTDTVLPHLAAAAILSSNTSGLSVEAMAQAMPPEVRRRFLVTHFFNPPRYMRLLELVPCADTDPQLLAELGDFLRARLGKGIVQAKDTPNFIANRIGVYAIFNAMRHMTALGLTVEEVDAVAGPATARPKSAAFRTADLVGLDTLIHVGNNSYELLPDDEEREVFRIPDYLQAMVAKGLLGNKSKGGFFRKEKGEGGKSQLFYYDPASGDYCPAQKPKFPSLQAAKAIDDPAARLRAVLGGNDQAAAFAWVTLRDVLLYAVRRIPEIADAIVEVDNAMKWGFNWELGPFEMLDAIGVAAFVARAEQDGVAVPAALKTTSSFYSYIDGRPCAHDLASGQPQPLIIPAGTLRLDILRRGGSVVEKNAGASLHDLGDGVFGLEFHSKMNSISSDILALTPKAIARAERDGVGLVIGNQGTLFSAGANLMLLAVALAEGAYDDIDLMVRAFQKATMAIKCARVPVVAAPFNVTLGGGCEYCLHATAITAHAETYMGLVEVGVGLLPAGGGTKEMALRSIRLAERFGIDVQPFIVKQFRHISMASVSTSAAELFDLGYLREGDSIAMAADGLIADAKAKVLALARNFRPARPLDGLPAPGRNIAATIKSQLWNLKIGGQITPYEEVMAGVIAGVICGGDVPAGTPISEQYLLDLEREAFLKLCGHKETAERIQHMLKTGKPLRN
ncbi:MAG TPA: 3-hydroxyacyl-CoA dehydrogenase [Desulfuromonas sp.]|nr:3-hydroxyacyl-CoA dehydrogenase [Desulfuromonas sp.]